MTQENCILSEGVVACREHVRARRKQQQSSTLVQESGRPQLPTEDEFFHLDDMEQFVQDAEATAAEQDPAAFENEADTEGQPLPQTSRSHKQNAGV